MGKYEGKLTIMRVWLVWLEMSRRILELMSRDFTCLFRFGANMLTRVEKGNLQQMGQKTTGDKS